MSKAVLKPLVKKEKQSVVKNKHAFKIRELISFSTAIKAICVFLLSGTSLIGGASPLGFACGAAIFHTDGYIMLAASLLGLLFFGSGLLTIGKYIIAAVIFSLIYERFLPNRLKNAGTCAIISALSLFASGIFLLFAALSIGGFPLIYDVVILIVECATVWAAVKAFSSAVLLLSALHIRRTLTTEETVSLAFLVGGVFCALGGIGIDGVFSLTGTLCVFSVLCFATRFGSLHGCTAGIIMGLISCISRGRIDACAASFAVSGLSAGYFSKHGKWAACISFIMANAVITILSNGSTEVLINIFDTFLAAIFLYCIPGKIFSALSGLSCVTHPNASLAASCLTSISSSLEQCENSFRKISKLRAEEDRNRILLYKRTAHKVCSNCGLRKYCWGRDASATKETLDTLTSVLLENGQPTPEDAPEHCLRSEKFIEEFNRMFDMYKNDCIWTARTEEFQSSVYASFSGISKLIKQTSERIMTLPDCDTVAADDIKLKLRKEGIIAGEIFVYGKAEETNIRLTIESCGGFGRCETTVRSVISEALGMPFVRTGLRNCGLCSCHYVVKPEFSITAAISKAVKSNKKTSGDHAIYALVDRHTYAVILCDGMGSGETAREESCTCAALIMQLLESGLDAQSAINIINSMLICSGSGSIAAIDLLLINLDDGASKLYKCGAAGTYTKIDGSVSLIDASSLPAGSIPGGDTDFFSIPSGKGSMIVLVSDGLTSLEENDSCWIRDTIHSYDGNEPATLTRLILDNAKIKFHSPLKDDITVVAAYIS